MTTQFTPSLAVHFVWHPSDKDVVGSILEKVTNIFSRDVERPFSRNLNVPIFLYSSDCPSVVPSSFPRELASKNVLFVFTSVNTRGFDEWNEYVENIPCSTSLRAVPIALDREGLLHGEKGSLKNLNFLRAYDWPDHLFQQHSILAMAHEIYRHGFVEVNEGDIGKSSSIKIFLSHTKSDDIGLSHAEAIKHFIDNTNMTHFFDATEISPGFRFDEEIIQHIKDSTIIAISSDAYSSRYWCQREILCAKEYQRPMISVDCLEDSEDRVFPAGSNVPCVHLSHAIPISENDTLRILSAALLETIRHHHSLKSLDYYKSRGWIRSACEIASRPPEVRQLLALKKEGKTNQLCYPEPPIYSEEAGWHQQLEIETFTPLWSLSEGEILKGFRVGISISDAQDIGSSIYHLPKSQTTRLAQDIARHLLARSATLIYGGDLRRDGFTEFILDEAIALKNRLGSDEVNVVNHLAWPIYRSTEEILAWRAKYRGIMKTVNHEIPSDVSALVDVDKFLPPTTAENKYCWSRCLSEMRVRSIESSNARICTGGKLCGYNGKMPGVLEEFLIAVEMDKPIYLLGAFGGVVGEVSKVIRGESYPDSLTESWQLTHNAGYSDVQGIAKSNGTHADYEQIQDALKSVSLSSLSKNSGLDEEKYLRLMESPFVDECVYLIMQGLKKL
jgi:hypothetical protein